MSDFNDFLNSAKSTDALSDVGQEQMYVNHHDRALLSVVEIEPMKSELDALGDFDITKDPRTLVPWMDGINIHLIATKVTKMVDGKQTDVELVERGPNGEVILPYGHKGLRQYERLTARDIGSGYVRVYNNQHRQMKIDFLKNWEGRSPQERFAFWWEMISRKFGAVRLEVGDAFWAYLVETKKDGQQYPYRNFYKVIKHPQTQAVMEAPWDIEIPFNDRGFIKDVQKELLAAKRKADAESEGFNYGANG